MPVVKVLMQIRRPCNKMNLEFLVLGESDSGSSDSEDNVSAAKGTSLLAFPTTCDPMWCVT